ncbi:MAG TPA: DUF1572 family protein [Terracidiphilus sp.]|nr:DUF1572 family protein [Terracidiphilus sp.]
MNEAADEATLIFLKHSREKLIAQFWPRLRSCVASLSEEQVWWRPNASSNSIGNLILHLNGNVTQWLIAPFNRLADERDRPAEFNRREGIMRDALLNTLAGTMEKSSVTLARLTPADLLEHFDIQGYRVTGLEAVYQVVEHFALHYGQIAFMTKMLRDEDLGFYRELNATGRRPASSPGRVTP